MNERNPSAEVLVKISRKLHLNLNWLMIGEGEMFVNESQTELTEKEQALLTHYRMMPDEVKNAFDVSFEKLAHKI